MSDSGTYTCVASSRSGKSAWAASLRLESPTNPNIAFFRAPEPSTLPGAPGKPQVTNRTTTTMTLTWTRSNKIGSSSLIGYQVEFFARDPQSQLPGQGWVMAAKRVTETTYTQPHLKPGLTYVFVVRAENSHGISLPSPASEAATTLGKPLDSMDAELRSWELEDARAKLAGHVVELSHAQPVNSTQVKLNWEV
ncbi:hypothetical protein B566_EDAN013243 [Ephemera danica]|nr:hypothetical protein B566_EDAN013243 [Ephemera danica]